MNILNVPPEILRLISDFLDHDALTKAVRTCKSWNMIMTPVLYRSFNHYQNPSAGALARHAHHIHYLDYQSYRQRDPLSSYSSLPGCSNLKGLDLSFNEGCKNEDRISAMVLILLNRKLLKLKIDEYNWSPEHQCYWSQALSHCSRSLQELSLVGIRLSAKDAQQLLSLAPTLQELQIENGITEWSGSFTANPQFPRLRKLDLNNALPTTADELEWIKQCPNLQDLSWSSSRTKDGSYRVAFSGLGTHRWRKLRSISIWGNTALDDYQIAMLLASCSALKSVGICGTEFWYQSLSALERHFDTLEVIEFKRNPSARLWMCHWFLCRSPKLSTIFCDLIPVHDLMVSHEAERSRLHQSDYEDRLDLQRLQAEADNGGNIKELMALVTRFAGIRDSVNTLPWVCLKLELLHSNFMIPANAGKDWDEAIFRHLSTLTKLKVLNMEDYLMGVPEGTRSLQLNLRSGLSELAPLKDLEKLLFEGTEQRMEHEDVQWILDQWPKLTNITTRLNTKKIKNLELQSMVSVLRDVEILSDSDTDGEEWDDSSSSRGDEDEDGDEDSDRDGDEDG
ncbi:hypothetical protein EMPS_02160 [Entomortierella parvispora]|uniref:F-box domain-containing protein n=1 Tax=Entomortierella parvispora TaxID=205924 RepID=A0A9P3H494_9FUNG|nr:hypothetical protein EMPS_02160 [Entomortierella parvispora]